MNAKTEHNWNAAMSVIVSAAASVDEKNSIRHDYGRKISMWEDATIIVDVPEAIASNLATIDLDPYSSPMDDLPDEVAGGIFIANVGGETYLVNTEGYNYSRYVARAKITSNRNPKERFTISFVTREDIAEQLNDVIEDNQFNVRLFTENDDRLTPEYCQEFATMLGHVQGDYAEYYVEEENAAVSEFLRKRFVD